MSNDDVSMGDESPTPGLPEMGTIDPALLVAETMIARANPGGTIDPAAARWAALHVPTDEWIDPVTITWRKAARPSPVVPSDTGEEDWTPEPVPGRRWRHRQEREVVVVPGRSPEDRERGDDLAGAAWRGLPVAGIAADPAACLPERLLARAVVLSLALPGPEEVRALAVRLAGGPPPRRSLSPDLCRSLTPDIWRLACEPGIDAETYQDRLAAGAARASTPPSPKAVVPTPRSGVVVVGTVGNGTICSAREVREGLGDVVGATLPLVATPDLETVRRMLSDEFPHCRQVIDGVLADVASQPHVRFRPVLLVGPPGAGKTRLATRFLETLGLSPITYPCGGVADSSLAGTARRWSSTEPCLPLARTLATGVANCGIVLDELEKAGSIRHNGSVMDALLALLERQTAAAYADPYVQAPVDLSHVCWVATANEVGGISPALRDRFRIVRVPEPSAIHLRALAQAVMRDLVAERGLDPMWGQVLDGGELGALSEVWRGGSLRSLSRYVGAILDARDRFHGFMQ